MRHGIIGTAGHVDHGKTCLIRALTGIDTDRLKEEKKRGITIELGFAWMDFPDGQRVGIVDVPGHEKFVRNMLAGVGGMDIVLLVIAADEGVMPQTVEHLDILSILGIQHGIIVLTKTDLADEELIDMVTEDARELAKGTFLENAPVIPVSVYDGTGLEELKETLYQMYRKLPSRKIQTDFRLPADRVFSLKGIGTVITGTLSEGKIRKNQTAMLYPEEVPVKIRSIQVHEQPEDTAWAGQRVAVNLPDQKKEDVQRGDVLAAENSLYPSYMADVRLNCLRHTERTIKTGSRVHVYHGTTELLGKVILMDREELKAGDSCYAQLRLEDKTVFKKGDRFVIRFFSPVETIGGGSVLDDCPGKHRRNSPKVLEAFRIKECGSTEEQLELAALEHWGKFFTLQELTGRNSLNAASVETAALKLENAGKLVRLNENLYIHREEMNAYRRLTEKFLKEYHHKFPLKEGMGIEEARSRLGIKDSGTADKILGFLEKQKIIRRNKGLLCCKNFHVQMQEADDAIARKIIQDYQNAGFGPLATEVYASEHRREKNFRAVFTSLLNKRILIRLDEQYCVHSEHYQKAKEAFAQMAETKPVILLGEYRDYLSCSRKVALALLEKFDREGYTRKAENGRCLKK